jgi:hypothetical protein
MIYLLPSYSAASVSSTHVAPRSSRAVYDAMLFGDSRACSRCWDDSAICTSVNLVDDSAICISVNLVFEASFHFHYKQGTS